MSDNHGNTPAAWTGVMVSFLGFVVGSFALMNNPVWVWLLIVGIVIAVAGLPVFWVMTKMGMGSH